MNENFNPVEFDGFRKICSKCGFIHMSVDKRRIGKKDCLVCERCYKYLSRVYEMNKDKYM